MLVVSKYTCTASTWLSQCVLPFPNLNNIFFGCFDPEKIYIFSITAINSFRADLSDVSSETNPLFPICMLATVVPAF